MEMKHAEKKQDDQLDLWEVFTQESDNAPHTHAGSIRAADSEHAIQNARDVFARRGVIRSIWVVKSDLINASSPEDADSMFDTIPEKMYRHPQFYRHTLDDELWNKK